MNSIEKTDTQIEENKNTAGSKKNETTLEPSKILKIAASTLLGSCFWLFFVWNRSSSWLHRSIVFLSAVRWPPFMDHTKPEKRGIHGVKNFYLTTRDNVTIGVWQILPTCLIKKTDDSPEAFDKALSDGRPIIVYVHGNSGTRATEHRIRLYKRFQSLGYHTITFDYRSYGDSDVIPPDEVGVVQDTVTVIQWVMEKKGSSPVFVWGHSLGTGVGSRTVTELEKIGTGVNGLILESPFNCFSDAVRGYPLTMLFKHMVGFEYFVIEPLAESGITFKTQEYLSNSAIPVLILHAEDDWIVPFKLGVKLHRYLLENRPNTERNVRFVKFSTKNGGYGHVCICDCPVLEDIVSSFVVGKLEDIPSCVD